MPSGPLLCGTKRAGAEGAPRRKGGKRHPRARFRRREPGIRVLLESGPGAPGGRAGPRLPRPARNSLRGWRPAQTFPASQPLYFYPYSADYYYYFFPAQSGNPGLPKRAAEGPPFPGESAARVGTGRPGKGTGGECPAPSPPPRRPGAHGRPRRPAHSGAAFGPRPRRPRPRPDLLRRGPPPDPGPFPPPGASAPLPLSARSSRRPTWAPSEPPPGRPCLGSLGPCTDRCPRSVPLGGQAPPSSPFCAPNSASPGALRSFGSSLARGPAAGPRILLLPPSSPKMPPAPRRPQEFYRFFSNPSFFFPEEASWAA